MERPWFRKQNKHKTFKNRTQVYFRDHDFFIIDPEDWDKIKDRCWRKSSGKILNGVRHNQYVISTGKDNRTVLLHRIIAGTPDGLVTDHVDGNFKNNRKSNLRICTQAQNNRNSRKRTKKKDLPHGIHYNKKLKNGYIARCKLNGKIVYIGYFDTEEKAEAALIAARNKHYGEYSPHWER